MRLLLKEYKNTNVKVGVEIELEPNPTDLELMADYNQTLMEILDKLNTYRGPDNQVKVLYNQYGQSIPLTYRIRSNLILYY